VGDAGGKLGHLYDAELKDVTSAALGCFRRFFPEYAAAWKLRHLPDGGPPSDPTS
jgi:hypothetical protein